MVSKFNGTPTEYVKAMKEMLKAGRTIEEVSNANHIALQNGLIGQKHFMAAAQMLVKEFLSK